jgi:RHS repeat-associated protein
MPKRWCTLKGLCCLMVLFAGTVQAQVKPPANYDFETTQPVGDLEFSHSVSSDGAAQISIPIEVPPGRRGVQPSLALSYSSRSGNGPLGIGWQLSGLSMITTCRRSPAIDDAFGGQYPDRFCLDGERLIGEPGGNQYKTEVDSFRKIVSYGPPDYPDSFDVYWPDGTIYRYASRSDSNARLEGYVVSCTWGDASPHTSDPAYDSPDLEYDSNDRFNGCQRGAVQRRAWMLDAIVDGFGNSMLVNYNADEHLLPQQIRYTQHATVADTKKIDFDYETRQDARLFSMDGVDYATTLRLKTIKVSGPLQLADSSYAQQSGVIRQYTLSYTYNPVTSQSTLTEVLECAGDENSSPCKASLNFSYSGSSITYEDKAFAFAPIAASSVFAGWDGFRTADVNGDGFDDLLYRGIDSNPVGGSWRYRLSDGSQFGDERTTGITAVLDDNELGAAFVSLDRNQTVDGLFPTTNYSYMVASGRADGNGTFDVEPFDGSLSAGVLPPRVVAIGDLNGDGLPDLAVRDNCQVSVPSIWCRWGVVLNATHDNLPISFGSALDFRFSPAPCTPSVVITAVGPTETTLSDCVEMKPGDRAFVVDIDGNGVNELITPIRQLPTEELCHGYPECGYSLELRALGFPLGAANTVRRTGLSSPQPSVPGQIDYGERAEPSPLVFIDVNGDRLADAIFLQDGFLSIAMNEGGSYGPRRGVTISAAASAAIGLPNEIRVGDFNNDGLEDIYLVSAGILLQSDGQLGFVEIPLQLPVGDDSCVPANCPGFARRRWDQMLDLNGDGLIDFVQRRGDQTHVLLRTGPAPGLLQAVTGGPLTPEVRFVYQAMPQIHTPGICVYPQNCPNKGMWLVAETGVKANVPTSDYPTGFNRTIYRYENGRVDVRGRGWLGFGRRTITDEQTGATVITDFDNVTSLVESGGAAAPYRYYPGAFKPSQETLQVDARMTGEATGKIRRTTTQYQYLNAFVGPARLGGNCPCVISSTLAEVRTTIAEADVSGTTIDAFVPIKSNRNTYAYNTYGLIIRSVAETFEGGFDANGAPMPGAKVKKREVVLVPDLQDVSNWIVQRFNKLTVTSTEPAREAAAASWSEPPRPAAAEQIVTRTTTYGWQPGTAALNKITTEPGSSTSLSLETDVVRDATGNIRSITMTDGQTERSTTIDWDTLDQTLPYLITNALQQRQTLYYHAALGAVAVMDDINGLRTVTRFDRFGRARTFDVPSQADTTIDYGLSPEGLLSVSTARTGHSVHSEYMNKWGRIVRTEECRFQNEIAVSEYTYTRLNQLATQTVPHYAAQGIATSADPGRHLMSPPASIAMRYDPLGRLRIRTVDEGFGPRNSSPDTVSWSYDGLTQHYVNAQQIESTTQFDAASRLVRAATSEPRPVLRPGEHVPLHPHVVVSRYEYGPFDVLDAVTDPAGNRIENQFDVLGRRIDIKDPSSGHSTAGYNSYGEAEYTVDGAGEQTTISLDLLGRIEKEVHFDAGPKSVETFVWDSAPNGIGKLARTVSTDGVETAFSYDTLGRLSSTEWLIGGQKFATQPVWDEFDRLQYFKYPVVPPNQLVLEYGYESGVLARIVNRDTRELYWKLIAQDATGVPLTEQISTSITTNLRLDSRHRLKSIQTNEGSGFLQQISYEYGPGSLISAQHSVPDNSVAADQTFDYDFLGRLVHWTVNQRGTISEQTYGYDDLGNLSSMTVDRGSGRTVTNTYGSSAANPQHAGPYAVENSLENGASSVFQYDPAGRQISGGNHAVTWNFFDLPSRIQSGTQDVSFQYDGAHQRVLKSGLTESVLYIGGAYERHTGSGSTLHVFNLLGPGGVFGQVVLPDPSAAGGASADTSFFHADILGTSETISHAANGSYEKVQYEPFGQRRGPSALAVPAALPSSRTFGFTGHEADDEFGLINMSGRIYDPQTARFLSPDPYVQAPWFSQSLNRYSYVNNNPVNFTDPTGFYCEDADICLGGGNDAGGDNSDSWGFEYGYGIADAGIPAGHGHSQVPLPTQALVVTQEDPSRQTADAGTGSGRSFFNDYQNYARDAWNVMVKAGSAVTSGFGSNGPGTSILGSLRAFDELAKGIKKAALNNNMMSDMDFEVFDLWTKMIPIEASAMALGKAGETATFAVDELTGALTDINAVRGELNCVNCAIATDYTLRGIPTEAARGGPYNYIDLENWMLNKFVPVTGRSAIVDILTQSGEGAQGIVRAPALSPGGVGHVWNAVNEGGTVRFLDTQVFTSEQEMAAKALSNFRNYKSFQFMLTKPGIP